MNYHDTCPCCGHVVTAYTLRMSRPLALSFLAFVKARVSERRPLSKGEIGLTNQQYANFQNLRHFGLIAQPEKAGPWDVTPLGWAWIRGLVTITDPAGHMGGVTLPPTHPAWATHDHLRREISLTALLPENFDMRDYYVAEKAGTNPIPATVVENLELPL